MGRLPFKAKPNERFKKLTKKLEQLKIISIEKDAEYQKFLIHQPDILLEVFRTIFLLFAGFDNFIFCNNTGRLIIEDGFKFSPISNNSEKAKDISNILIPIVKDRQVKDSRVYENAFNALLAIYLASNEYLRFIYPNTHIVELGENTHELDIFLATQDGKYIIVETTRGYNKELDNVKKNYSWHFKSAVFRKWMIDKFYGIECCLCYVTLKNDYIQTTVKGDLPKELSKETKNIKDDKFLIDQIVKMENNKIQIINLGTSLEKTLNQLELDELIKSEIIDKLKSIF